MTATPRVQPVSAQTISAELTALVAAGTLVDLAGRPPVSSPRDWCGGATVGDTCQMSLDCPSCYLHGGRAGSLCDQPSGHTAAEPHRSRLAAADDARQAAGDLTLPAPWPKRRPAATAAADQLTRSLAAWQASHNGNGGDR
jgi:hypothetical protein